MTLDDAIAEIKKHSPEEIDEAMRKRAEISRASIPTPMENPDFNALIGMMEDVKKESIAKGYEDDNFKHYVYEMAMQAVYGKDYFVWRNAQKW